MILGVLHVLLKRVEKIEEEYRRKEEERRNKSFNVDYSNLREGYDNSLFDSFSDFNSQQTNQETH